MALTVTSLDRLIDFVHGSEYFFGLKGAIRVEEKFLVHQSGLCGLRKPSHEPFTLGYGHSTLLIQRYFNAYHRVQFVFLAGISIARQCGVGIAFLLWRSRNTPSTFR
jgi:hypothetical protein